MLAYPLLTKERYDEVDYKNSRLRSGVFVAKVFRFVAGGRRWRRRGS